MSTNIQLKNDYVLLEDGNNKSQFSSQSSGSFLIASPIHDYKVGDKVYLYPGEYPKTVIDEKEYTVVRAEDILGVENAS